MRQTLMTKDDVYEKLKEIFVRDFDIEESLIAPDASLDEDLNLDSIDATDMIVKLKPYLKASLEPETFKTVKTVQNVIDVIAPIWK